ncbi:MAG: lytic transglycosylase domain-containing protein [Acidobacteria bacterium]|jgi:soluble lytic murein transglycosylase-like protein|nr:lytic transglycosylase domain-containing protein [Acidobacteriota bacterium]
MIAKNPVKRFTVVLSVLALLAVASLLAQMVETNHNYERSLSHVSFLQSRLGDSQEQLLQLNQEMLANDKKYERIEQLQFRDDTFRKKFPEFSRIIDVAYQKARRYGFSPNLVLSVIQVESAFNPAAVSSAGAFGLMQVRYSVWKDELAIDRSRIFDIDYNIDLGLRILKQYRDLSGGSMQRALFLYNNGYKYNNGGYIAKVNASIYNQEPERSAQSGVSH